MKKSNWLFTGLSVIVILSSCTKDDVTNPDNTAVEKKYLLRADGHVAYFTESLDVVTSYKYDIGNRLLNEIQNESSGVGVELYDSIVYVYNGADTVPSRKDRYDMLPGGGLYSSQLFFYNGAGLLIKDSVINESATYYTYTSNQLITRFVDYTSVPSGEVIARDTLTKDASGNNFASAVSNSSSDGRTLMTLTYNTNVFNPYWSTGGTTSMYAHADDDIASFGDMIGALGRNAITSLTNTDSYGSSDQVNLVYQNVVNKWPGKMVFTSSAAPGATYTVIFTYK
ncbi:hypothetical protein LK994_10405 [Ferruginibacter lapsinanis]|uniref:hypothetical protein n=1 Tax=Ferruginibacter lapsinanis TaxID=563172 RepID=UPI001E57AB13|nr:hypothetical protein [Ferruginibacter lapsinanis]UEG49042.1 hypothetical protein LK994_10405 [Ferruginibacter lapsinanis]